MIYRLSHRALKATTKYKDTYYTKPIQCVHTQCIVYKLLCVHLLLYFSPQIFTE